MHASKSHQSSLPLPEAFALIFYHVRLLNWWLFLLMALGFIAGGGLVWIQLTSGNILEATKLSVFTLEGGAGLIAATLTSTLLIGDPTLELTMVTHTGAGHVLVWRYILNFLILLCCSGLFLIYCLLLGINYGQAQSTLSLLLVWLAPVLFMSMLSLVTVLKTRNSTLGIVITLIPLVAQLILHEPLLDIQAIHALFIPYSYWARNEPDWLLNRLSLLGLALLLALWAWFLVRREEQLLDQRQ